MEKNGEPRNTPLHMWPIDFQQECQDNSMEKGKAFQQMVLGKLDIYIQKNEIGPLHHMQNLTQNRSKTKI